MTGRQESSIPNADILEELGLTHREAEVLACVAQGKTNIEVAMILSMNHLTVKKHLERIFRKLGVENRTAAAMLAIRYERKKGQSG